MSSIYTLHSAAQSGDARQIKFLIQKGANIYEKDSNGFDPFFYAINRNCVDSVQALVEADDKDWTIKFSSSVFKFVIKKTVLLCRAGADEIDKHKNCRIFDLLINKTELRHIQNKGQVSALVKITFAT